MTYISLEAAIQEHCSCCGWQGNVEPLCDGCKEPDNFRSIPSADVVEVVRCKDCIHNCGEGFAGGTVACGISNLFTVGKDPMDFCSSGERRT